MYNECLHAPLPPGKVVYGQGGKAFSTPGGGGGSGLGVGSVGRHWITPDTDGAGGLR